MIDAGEVSFGPFRFDVGSGVLLRNGTAVPLAPRALAVLECLVEEPGKLVSKQELLDAAWDGAAVTDDSLVEAIKVVRQALGDNPQQPAYIQTVHRRGYRFIAPVSMDGKVATLGKGHESGWWAQRAGAAVTHGIRVFTRWERPILWTMVGLLTLVASIAPWRLGNTYLTPGLATSFVMSLPPSLPVSGGDISHVAISPDGTRIVYVAGVRDGTQLVLKEWDRFGFTPVPGTEGADQPFFSPDGQWVGFTAEGGAHSRLLLKKVALDGSPPVTLGAYGLHDATWGPDNNIYGRRHMNDGIHRVSADGGEPQALTTPDRSKGEGGHLFPQLLPDGETLLFTAYPETLNFEDCRAVLLSLETGEQKTLLEGVSRARYVPTGHLVYTRENTLWARPFDLSNFEVRGQEVRVIEGITRSAVRTSPAIAFSDTGTLIYRGSADELGLHGGQMSYVGRVVWLDRNGASWSLSLPTQGFCLFPSLSPDGQRLALACQREAGFDVWLGNFERETSAGWPSEGEDSTPIWTPDGNSITYSSHQGNKWSINSRPADGSGPAKQLLERDFPLYPQSWSPDGKVLAYQEVHPETGEDIWLLPLERKDQPLSFVNSSFHESGARFSPDGRWMAYHSNESGTWHVYVRAYPGPTPKIQISTIPGGWPVWSRDGRELFYLTHSGEAMMAVEISYEPEFNPEQARRLFDAGSRHARSRQGPTFDLAPDGQRFVMVEMSPGPTNELNVVLNWFEELKRLVPTAQ